MNKEPLGGYIMLAIYIYIYIEQGFRLSYALSTCTLWWWWCVYVVVTSAMEANMGQ